MDYKFWFISIRNAILFVYVIVHVSGSNGLATTPSYPSITAIKPCDGPRYCDQDVLYPDPSNCSYYLICNHLEYEQMTCAPIDLCFDKDLLDCVHCGNGSVCQEPCPSPMPTSALITGPCEAHEELCRDMDSPTPFYFPDNNLCEKYYPCVNGTLETIPKDCPQYFIFDFANQNCSTKTPAITCDEVCSIVPPTTETTTTGSGGGGSTTTVAGGTGPGSGTTGSGGGGTGPGGGTTGSGGGGATTTTEGPTPPPIGLTGAAIAGIVIGTVAALCLLILLILLLLKGGSEKVEPAPSEMEDATGDATEMAEDPEGSTPQDENNNESAADEQDEEMPIV